MEATIIKANNGFIVVCDKRETEYIFSNLAGALDFVNNYFIGVDTGKIAHDGDCENRENPDDDLSDEDKKHI